MTYNHFPVPEAANMVVHVVLLYWSVATCIAPFFSPVMHRELLSEA